jgi:antitoxin component YwqK of YwqJK toxin-antitoxin module
MKTSFLKLLTLIFSLFSINGVATELDENLQQRCNSLPFSLEGTPQTGKFGSGDPNVEYKGKLIDGIAHIFYPSGKLQRRMKRIDENGNPDLKGNRSIGLYEVFDEECYLVNRGSRNNNGDLSGPMEVFVKGLLSVKGNHTNNKAEGIWEIYDNEVLTKKEFYKNGVYVSAEYYENGNLTRKGPWSADGIEDGLWSYYKDGELIRTQSWDNGVLLSAEFYENEELGQKNYYKSKSRADGTREFVAVSGEYYENGNLTMKGPWSAEGNTDGLWTYYENGTLYREITWQNGKNIKQVGIYPSITCKKLVSDFGANEMRALRDHKDKTYIVSARVSSVGADFNDNPQITLSDGNQFSFNSCMAFPAKGEDFYYDLNQGQLVKMQCTITGEVMGSPMLKRCVLAN